MNKQQKIDHVVHWFMHQDEYTRRKALAQLVEHAINSDLINVWDPESREELASEEGRSVTDYEAPYFRSCGDPLGK